jgi:hypothetical protein
MNKANWTLHGRGDAMHQRRHQERVDNLLRHRPTQQPDPGLNRQGIVNELGHTIPERHVPLLQHVLQRVVLCLNHLKADGEVKLSDRTLYTFDILQPS